MMSSHKKLVRENFRNACLERDGNKCKVCGNTNDLQVHHICDKSLIFAGGSIPENGITLCSSCHELAEEYHKTGMPVSGYSQKELYDLIGSSLEKAIKTAQRKG